MSQEGGPSVSVNILAHGLHAPLVLSFPPHSTDLHVAGVVHPGTAPLLSGPGDHAKGLSDAKSVRHYQDVVRVVVISQLLEGFLKSGEITTEEAAATTTTIIVRTVTPLFTGQ